MRVLDIYNVQILELASISLSSCSLNIRKMMSDPVSPRLLGLSDVCLQPSVCESPGLRSVHSLQQKPIESHQV